MVSAVDVVTQTEVAALSYPRGAGDDKVCVRLARICMLASTAEAADFRSDGSISACRSTRLCDTSQEGTHSHL